MYFYLINPHHFQTQLIPDNIFGLIVLFCDTDLYSFVVHSV